MVGAFLHTFFEGLDIKCSLAAYALLNDRDGEGYGMEKEKRLTVRPIALGLAAAMGGYLVLLNGMLRLLAASALGGLLAAGLARREKGKRAKRHKTPRSRR